ncbi:hypothetical protein [Gilvimarinus sp. 1_MG-2023]|uniref:hypothetical protein n=1 Tax=Gilvimarinus sp. 1_MG-2023 TaxID=3062638 RepID=UPI0026E35A58|nr:hypothetical protein [Gilvimarinus sp. 1_MG-2023]MDO6747164.1 hypothetical protein [Gilvimarinus sp. 1_MG-2023]
MPPACHLSLARFWLWALLILPGVSTAQPNYDYTCQLGETTRLIEVAYLVPEQTVPCEVRYQKNDEPGLVLWRANNQTGFCENKAQKLIREHEALGFTCHSDNRPDNLPEFGRF